MIENKICPYCRKPMIKAENKPNSRSVEALIPTVVFTRKRKNDEGDFYACRECNSRKSNIDYILGVVSKGQSAFSELSSKTIIDALSKENGASKRFVKMIQTARKVGKEVQMDIPFKGGELIEYIHFLGKGQFFKKNQQVFNPNQFVMEVLFANKTITKSLEEAYILKHKSHPWTDLGSNKYTEVINGSECMIYSKNNNYMFVVAVLQ